MNGVSRPRKMLPALLSTFALGSALIPASAASMEAVRAETSSRCLAVQGGGQGGNGTIWTRNFNPFAAGSSLVFNTSAIYEPLIDITPAGGGHVYPWLATGYRWMDGNRILLLTVRQGVKWSDGVPFTAKDVIFTLTYGKQYPGADQNGLWGRGILTSVNAVGTDQVAVHLKKVDTTILPQIVTSIRILPQHIWATIKNPATYTNPNPVGTGPFTQLTFSPQQYTLGKNPYYWQTGKPAVPCLAFPYETNVTAFFHGDIDWAQNFAPDLDKTFVAKDPAHNHYFFAPAAPVSLMFNDTRYPFSLVGFRKAISYGIDRARISTIGEYGYEPPSDAIGVALTWPTWANRSLAAAAKELATYNPTKARSLLSSLGFITKNGQLYDPRGKPVSITFGVPDDWPDFVTDTGIFQNELQQLGIQMNVKKVPDAIWFDQSAKGLYDVHLNFPTWGANPYYYFNGYMSKEFYVPTGQNASANGGANYERWWSPDATALLAQFRQTTDPTVQHAIIDKLQRIQLDNLPTIPVMYGAMWYEYRSKYFVGWPSATNYYAVGGPGISYPDDLVVETRLVPVQS